MAYDNDELDNAKIKDLNNQLAQTEGRHRTLRRGVLVSQRCVRHAARADGRGRDKSLPVCAESAGVGGSAGVDS